MMFIKVETINEGILRSAIRFACENQGVPPDECYEVIGRKILNGESTAICGSWHDTFCSYYSGAAAFFGPTSGFQDRENRIADLEKQLAAANDRLVREDMARREPETVQDYTDAFTEISAGQVAYEAWQNLPATQKETKPWGMLSGPERSEWRVIGGAVVASLTDNTKPTKPLVFDDICSDCSQSGGGHLPWCGT